MPRVAVGGGEGQERSAGRRAREVRAGAPAHERKSVWERKPPPSVLVSLGLGGGLGQDSSLCGPRFPCLGSFGFQILPAATALLGLFELLVAGAGSLSEKPEAVAPGNPGSRTGLLPWPWRTRALGCPSRAPCMASPGPRGGHSEGQYDQALSSVPDPASPASHGLASPALWRSRFPRRTDRGPRAPGLESHGWRPQSRGEPVNNHGLYLYLPRRPERTTKKPVIPGGGGWRRSPETPG